MTPQENSYEVADKLSDLETALAPELQSFRSAARNYAAWRLQGVQGFSGAAARQRRGREQVTGRRLVAACAGLLFACGAALVAPRLLPHPAAPVAAPAAASSLPTDEAVLNSVESDLRSGVPLAMQPLAVTAEAAPAGQASASRKN